MVSMVIFSFSYGFTGITAYFYSVPQRAVFVKPFVVPPDVRALRPGRGKQQG